MADGQRQKLTGAILVGRDPAADSRWPGAVLMSVVDATKTVSKTHAVFEVDGSGLWVTDLHSSNGTFIDDPAGEELDAEPDMRIAAPDGSSVMLGDFLVKVERE
jgi:pSer/pThr/pTyr-binding forkhead associated (FHA) protein